MPREARDPVNSLRLCARRKQTFAAHAQKTARKSVRLRGKEYLEETLVPVDNRPRFARSDVEGFLRRRCGAIPPAAAERREQGVGVGEPGGPRLNHLNNRLQI